MISVVIPAYNSESTIVDCINGVLNQTAIDKIREIIVVDDGSKDGTVEVVKSSIDCDKVRVVSKENGGVSTARNAGIRNSSGEWVALLDSDDVWSPDKIEKQLKAIEAHPEICFIGANRNNENVRIGTCVEGNLYKLSLRDILIKNWPHTSTALIRRSVLDEVGLFDENMKYAEDGNMWIKICINHPLYYIAESLEVAGGFKFQYGESGLSSNLKGMYDGNVENLRWLKKNSYLNAVSYLFWRFYFWAKYIRRIIVVKLRKMKR